MRTLRKKLVCVLVLTIVLTLARVPEARAQTTSITNVQAPSTAMVGRGVHVTFTVSYSRGYGGASIGIGIADADNIQTVEGVQYGAWVYGRLYASTPNECMQGADLGIDVNSTYCELGIGSTYGSITLTPGSEDVDFVFIPQTARTYHLEATAFVTSFCNQPTCNQYMPPLRYRTSLS